MKMSLKENKQVNKEIFFGEDKNRYLKRSAGPHLCFILKLSCKSIACSLLIFNVKHELKAGEKITPIQKITLWSKELSVCVCVF